MKREVEGVLLHWSCVPSFASASFFRDPGFLVFPHMCRPPAQHRNPAAHPASTSGFNSTQIVSSQDLGQATCYTTIAAVGLQLPHFDLDTVFASTPSSSFATLPIFRSGSSHPRLLALPSNSVFGPFVEARLLIRHILISKVQSVHDSTSVPRHHRRHPIFRMHASIVLLPYHCFLWLRLGGVRG